MTGTSLCWGCWTLLFVCLALAAVPRAAAQTGIEDYPNVVRQDIVNISADEVSIAYLYPFQNTWTLLDGVNEISLGIQMALDDINNDTKVLPNRTFTVKRVDNKNSEDVEMFRVMEEIDYSSTRSLNDSKGQPMLVLGSFEDAAVIAARAGRTVVSATSDLDALHDRVRFPTYSRLAPRITVEAQFAVHLVQHFGWRRVGVINSIEDDSVVFMSNFRRLAVAAGIEVVSAQVFDNAATDYSAQLAALKSTRPRIIVAHFSIATGRVFWEEARKAGLLSPLYNWICGRNAYASTLSAPAAARELTVGVTGISSASFVASTSPGFAFLLRLMGRATIPPGLTFNQLIRIIGASLAFSAYTTVYGCADALHSLIELKKKCVTAPSAADCVQMRQQGEDRTLLDIFRGQWFRGIPWNFTLDAAGEPLVRFLVVQNSATISPAVVGTIDATGKFFQDLPLTFSDGTSTVPPDRAGSQTFQREVSTAASVAMGTLAGITTMFALYSIGFNILYRRKPVIRLSSPGINVLSLCGAVIALCAVPLLRRVSDVNCQLSIAFITVGFNLFFGGLFAKTYRLHSIFDNTLLSAKKVLKTAHTLGVVAVLVALDACILAIWFLWDPVDKKITVLSTRETAALISTETVALCHSDYIHLFLPALFVKNGALLVFGTWLAYRTRNISMKQANDSIYIGASIYSTTLINLFAIPVMYSLSPEQVDERYIFLTGSLILQLSVAIVLLVVPKLFKTYITKEGLITSSSSGSHSTGGGYGVKIVTNGPSGQRSQVVRRPSVPIASKPSQTVSISPVRQRAATQPGLLPTHSGSARTSPLPPLSASRARLVGHLRVASASTTSRSLKQGRTGAFRVSSRTESAPMTGAQSPTKGSNAAPTPGKDPRDSTMSIPGMLE